MHSDGITSPKLAQDGPQHPIDHANSAGSLTGERHASPESSFCSTRVNIYESAYGGSKRSSNGTAGGTMNNHNNLSIWGGLGISRPYKTRSISELARKNIIVAAASVSAAMLIVLSLTWISKGDEFPVSRSWNIARSKYSPILIKAWHGAVAAENTYCSQVGVEVLKDGGNAVDAAIASCLCTGVTNAFSSGIGGGGFMTIRLPNGTVETIDFRETAPGASTSTMYSKDPTLAQTGALAIAVPGELRGLDLAHRRHGKLPWSRLLAPSVKLAREGWVVEPLLAVRLETVKWLMESDLHWSRMYAPKGKVAVEGEWVRREVLADTLETIGREGADAFYTGAIALSMVNYVRERGGQLTMEDLRDYKAVVRQPVVGYYHGRKIYTSPAPTSGPTLLSILNIVERYNFGRGRVAPQVETHRLVEAMKFAFAQRTELCDPDFHNLTSIVDNMLSKDTAAHIRANISDTQTFPIEYYNPHFDTISNQGTTHLSTVDKDDMAVALTSSVNWLFGAKVMDPKTGVIFNDQMDDFSIPGRLDGLNSKPSPYNYPQPGKRPVSSAVPTIVEKDGRFEMALGASGGTRIINVVLQTILNVYHHNMNIMEAIERPRIHHALMPDELSIEDDFPESEIEFLKNTIGHTVLTFNRFKAMAEVQGVMKQDDGFYYAASDSRKLADAAGY
ncbi:hypothetical protein EDD11_002416 [Mortierella claussenii]|nr:hypothetical protein EDD11_002416 [Mortierella claussenii]